MRSAYIGLAVVAAVAGFAIWRNLNPVEIGIKDGQLRPCPDRPSCVSSQAAEPGQKVDPFPVIGSARLSLDLLESIILENPSAEISDKTERYLRAVYRSKVFGFRDDVEFLVVGGQVEVKSVSRLGYYDFGVNRGRVEAIRSAYMDHSVEEGDKE